MAFDFSGGDVPSLPNGLRLRPPNYTPIGNLGPATPAVPASTVAVANNAGVDCEVYITGGTVTAVTVGGVATGLTGGAFRVPVNQTIAITYSVAPTWTWFGD